MNDPYIKLYESINDALAKLSNTIALLAQRTLSVKDYNDFVNEVKKGEKNREREDHLGFPDSKDK